VPDAAVGGADGDEVAPGFAPGAQTEKLAPPEVEAAFVQLSEGSAPMTPSLDYIFSRATEDSSRGCWIWNLSLNRGGYATIKRRDGTYSIHRVVYEQARGEIPDGFDIDHLCRTRNCVNPWHMEPVSRRVNVGRGNQRFNGRKNAAKTHCLRGHEYTTENTFLNGKSRSCKECRRAADLAYKERRRRL
jgi:hypothetical protein